MLETKTVNNACIYFRTMDAKWGYKNTPSVSE